MPYTRLLVRPRRGVRRGDAGRDRGRLIECELEEHQPAAKRVVRRHVNAHEIRLQVGIRQEVLTGDLTLPPGPPVVEAEEQGIEGFIARGRGIVPLEEREAVGERRL